MVVHRHKISDQEFQGLGLTCLLMYQVRLTDYISSGEDKELFDNFSKSMEIPEVCSNNELRAALKCLIPRKKSYSYSKNLRRACQEDRFGKTQVSSDFQQLKVVK